MLKFISLVLCVAFVVAQQNSKASAEFKLPAGTITCQIDSDNRDECIKEAIQDMLPKLVNGMPSLRIPPIDPYYVERHAANYRRGDAFLVSGVVRDVRIYGAAKAQIQDVKTKITKNHISGLYKAYIPQSIVEGYYKGEGRFNGMKVKSKGFFNITAADVNVMARTEADIITMNGVEYVNMTKFDITPTFGKMKIYATGIIPDPELNRMALDFVNQYWQFLYREMLPESKKRMEPILLAEVNKFLSYVPIRKMLYYAEEPIEAEAEAEA